jgi:hypothetical protein|tara:strand:- start:542 stop:739 length:198 start_codon:yes stop_codon:yes gene_type:complete
MSGTRTTPLPIPRPDYDQQEEASTRRILELAIDQIENDIVLAKSQGDKTGSLAMRRFQFLLMGAS